MLKINQLTRRLAVRSLAANAQLLREAGDRLCAKRKAPRWSLYCLDGRETTPDEPDAVVKFYPVHLSSMQHFRVCHKNEGIWEIAVGAEGAYEPNMLASVVERFRSLNAKQARVAQITYFIDGPFRDGEPVDLGRIDLTFGWRAVMEPRGYLIRVFSSNARSSSATRYAFVTNAIQRLGCAGIVRVLGNEKEFTLRAANGWSLYDFEKRLDKRNSHDFTVGPFPSFDDVWRRVERFRAGPRGKQIDRLSISFCMTPDVYDTMYGQLNELANEWGILSYGSYADGIDPYTADASQSPDGRFPVFVWSPEQGEGDLFYQADIVPTIEGRFLEIHSNCGDMKRLLKEAESATGMKFTPTAEKKRGNLTLESRDGR